MALANRRNIVVKDQLWKQLKEISKKEGRSLSELIREALIDFFNKKRRESSHYDPVKDKFGPQRGM